MTFLKPSEKYESLTKKLAFLAVFGVTGVAAFAAYKLTKKQLDFDIDWDEVWRDIK